jgi:hypothetical protein
MPTKTQIMSKKGKILTALITIVVVAMLAFPAIKKAVYNLGKRDIKTEKAAYTVTSKNIVAEFTANVEIANKKYLEKPVAISGTVTSVNGKEVILDEMVNCNFTTADAALKSGQAIVVKGRVVGFDDLLGELKLDQCNQSNIK